MSGGVLRQLTGLQPVLFQHPSDRAILEKLEAVPLIPGMVGKLMDTVKVQMEMNLLANSFHVTAESFPVLHAVYQRVCAVLCVGTPPELYLEYSPGYNAYMTGVDRAIVVVSSTMAAEFNERELAYVLGHELGHYLSGHVKYQTLVRLLAGGTTMALGGVAKIAADVTFAPLLYLWSRRAEYTCDRAGLLACQDVADAHRTNLRLAGCPRTFIDSLPPDLLLKQADEFNRRVSGKFWESTFAGINQIYRTHPRVIERSAELKNWIDEGWFADIVDGTDESRRKLAGQISADPKTADTMRMILRFTGRFAAGEFGLPHGEAAQLVRRAIYSGETLKNTALERIMRIELAITRGDSEKMKYEVRLLVNRDGRPVIRHLEIPMSESWDDVPKPIRREFISRNEKTIVNKLYSVGS